VTPLAPTLGVSSDTQFSHIKRRETEILLWKEERTANKVQTDLFNPRETQHTMQAQNSSEYTQKKR
jgi:hypothetical protein